MNTYDKLKSIFSIGMKKEFSGGIAMIEKDKLKELIVFLKELSKDDEVIKRLREEAPKDLEQLKSFVKEITKDHTKLRYVIFFAAGVAAGIAISLIFI